MIKPSKKALMQSLAISLVALLQLAQASANAADSQDDPHWNKATCQVCHEEAAPAADNIALRPGSDEALCQNCHGPRGGATPCRHASGILPRVLADAMPSDYQAHLSDGRIVCTTCHDLAVQCENPKRSLQYKNPGFVRGGRFANSSDQCYLCHDSSNYEKLDPHKGVAGNPARPSCLLCHTSMPESNDAGGLDVSFNMKHDLNDICRGCHNVSSHPAAVSFSTKPKIEWAHLTVPSEEVLQKMRKFTEESGIVLPLDPGTGKIFCATCHNQHPFQLGGSETTALQGSESRLRADDMCDVCHAK
jgi:hypothetical protein